jgi:hypothetical protein
MGFEPTIQVLERAKTLHALHGEATVIGIFSYKGIVKQSS